MRFERFPIVLVLLLTVCVGDRADVWSIADHRQH